jgi:hypothetical protein
MPSPPPITAAEPLTVAHRARIARWVASQIVSWPPDNCFCCKRPIIFGAKWTELVNDNDRARFHFDCAPVWRAQQEAAARQAMGLDRNRHLSLAAENFVPCLRIEERRKDYDETGRREPPSLD